MAPVLLSTREGWQATTGSEVEERAFTAGGKTERSYVPRGEGSVSDEIRELRPEGACGKEADETKIICQAVRFWNISYYIYSKN